MEGSKSDANNSGASAAAAAVASAPPPATTTPAAATAQAIKPAVTPQTATASPAPNGGWYYPLGWVNPANYLAWWSGWKHSASGAGPKDKPGSGTAAESNSTTPNVAKPK